MAKRHRNSERAEQIRANTVRVKQECTLSPWDGEPGRCHWCNTPLEGRQRSWCSRACQNVFERNHVWSLAKSLTKRRAQWRCQHCGIKPDRLEVNHINPVRGAGYSLACHHHLDNLEALCHPCHVAVTNQQRQDAQN